MSTESTPPNLSAVPDKTPAPVPQPAPSLTGGKDWAHLAGLTLVLGTLVTLALTGRLTADETAALLTLAGGFLGWGARGGTSGIAP